MSVHKKLMQARVNPRMPKFKQPVPKKKIVKKTTRKTK